MLFGAGRHTTDGTDVLSTPICSRSMVWLTHTHTSSLLRWWSVQHWVRNLQWTSTEWIADSLKPWSPTSCLTKALQVFLALSETIDTTCWRFGKRPLGHTRWHTTALTFLVGKAWATKARPSSWEFRCWDPREPSPYRDNKSQVVQTKVQKPPVKTWLFWWPKSVTRYPVTPLKLILDFWSASSANPPNSITHRSFQDAAWPQGARTVHGSLLTALMKSHPQYGALAEVNRALGCKNGGMGPKITTQTVNMIGYHGVAYFETNPDGKKLNA